jgi:hypothetical protein
MSLTFNPMARKPEYLNHQKYSTARGGQNGKAHIYSHDEQERLCHATGFANSIKINKTRHNRQAMLEVHRGFTSRRGRVNPWRYTCQKCYKVLLAREADPVPQQRDYKGFAAWRCSGVKKVHLAHPSQFGGPALCGVKNIPICVVSPWYRYCPECVAIADATVAPQQP